MKIQRGILFIVVCFLLLSFVSSEIIFDEQFKPVYNLGENIFIPVTITTSEDLSGIFQMDLICNGVQNNFYKNGISLASGEEASVDSTLVLIRNVIGTNRGVCKIKTVLNKEYILSDEFIISDALFINSTLGKSEYNSGDLINISGKVLREDGTNSEGFIEITIHSDGEKNLSQTGTVHLGTFNLKILLPENFKAGNYISSIRAFEKDSDSIETNHGQLEIPFYVNQVPTSLELIFESTQIMPGNSLKVKSILHDQTGEPINSTSFITIKNSFDKILEQKEISNGEYLSYPIKSMEPPSTWKVFVISNKLSAENEFEILAKEFVEVEIINKTIFLKNVGNVPYNKTILVKIEETPINIQANLDVGESKGYILTAPNGEYKVSVITPDSDGELSKVISLTGKAIGIQESSGSFPIIFVWIILIIILALVLFFIIRKFHKKSFVGRSPSIKKKISPTAYSAGLKPVSARPQNAMILPGSSKAELSLSIKGEKQDASVVCVKIKNLRTSGEGSVLDTVKRITNLAEERKAAVYENQDYLFFIFAPIKTRTFKNEKTALSLAESALQILNEHNKKFNQKIDFGISLNYGPIVARADRDSFKFMALGNLVTISKKIASVANGELLLSEQANDLLRLQIKTEKEIRDGTSAYLVKEIKKESDETKKFINRFMNRQ